jgi:hypothetical protein
MRYLITNKNDIDIADNYPERCKIEKLPHNPKGFAFDIEKTKIRKSGRVERLLDLSAHCHALMVFLGNFVKFTQKTFQIPGTLLSPSQTRNGRDIITSAINLLEFSPSFDFAKM